MSDSQIQIFILDEIVESTESDDELILEVFEVDESTGNDVIVSEVDQSGGNDVIVLDVDENEGFEFPPEVVRDATPATDVKVFQIVDDQYLKQEVIESGIFAFGSEEVFVVDRNGNGNDVEDETVFSTPIERFDKFRKVLGSSNEFGSKSNWRDSPSKRSSGHRSKNVKSPGRTQLPVHRQSGNSSGFYTSASPTTPDLDSLEAIAISVASEQDLVMRTDLAMKTLATNFQASTKAGVKKSNRNVTKDSKTETKEPAATEDLDAVEAYLNSVQIMDYSSANNKDQKAKSRRKRINSSLEYLRKLVPGIGTDTDQSEVYAQTARYVSFLRQLASKKNIEDFISENVLAI